MPAQLENKPETPVILKLSELGERIRKMDPNSHSALLISIIGGFKGAARYQPDSIQEAAKTIEILVTDFEEHLGIR